jgi:hypothetical protein
VCGGGGGLWFVVFTVQYTACMRVCKFLQRAIYVLTIYIDMIIIIAFENTERYFIAVPDSPLLSIFGCFDARCW